MPVSDPHNSCLKCLGDSYVKEHCWICKNFWPCTQKERDIHLRALLMESTLCPASEPSIQAALSALASHSTPLAPGSSQHRSLSPVPKKKAKKHSPALSKKAQGSSSKDPGLSASLLRSCMNVPTCSGGSYPLKVPPTPGSGMGPATLPAPLSSQAQVQGAYVLGSSEVSTVVCGMVVGSATDGMQLFVKVANLQCGTGLAIGLSGFLVHLLQFLRFHMTLLLVPVVPLLLDPPCNLLGDGNVSTAAL
ncbi:hypothetical protein UY3_08568 [Chelonia mydas]|uniref:Uncharacterized protein n=1 Tax=Chelonia mydas TaxID=8469 RepID=M7BQA9_CHEMY|nr:hypothetical protein UY3_08568 [Chelonia mydas]